jgi:hypothetical protein
MLKAEKEWVIEQINRIFDEKIAALTPKPPKIEVKAVAAEVKVEKAHPKAEKADAAEKK